MKTAKESIYEALGFREDSIEGEKAKHLILFKALDMKKQDRLIIESVLEGRSLSDIAEDLSLNRSTVSREFRRIIAEISLQRIADMALEGIMSKKEVRIIRSEAVRRKGIKSNYFGLPISFFEFSARTRRALERNRIFTAEALIKNMRDISSLPGIGKAVESEIYEKVIALIDIRNIALSE